MKKICLILLVFMLSISSALALDMKVDIGESFGMAGEMLSKILMNEYAVFFITLIIGSIMLKGVYASGLSKVSHIEASGHVNSIAWCLSLLTVIAFVAGQRSMGMAGMINNLGQFKIILFILVFVLIYQGVKKTLSGAS